MILRTHNLTKHFGGIAALDGVSVEFRPGTITALVGSNGAGKSTLLNVIGGLIPPDSGEVTLGSGGECRLTGLQPHAVARLGVGTLFQDVRVFRKLSALENAAVGARSQPGEHPALSLFRRGAARARECEVLEGARARLESLGLGDKADYWAESLSYGEQKLVALARLFMSGARVLLLDEPTSGLHADKADLLLHHIRRMASEHDRTVILIEHNHEIVARVSDYAYALEGGRIVSYGSPSDVLCAQASPPNRPPTRTVQPTISL